MQVGGIDRLISPPEVSKTLGFSPRSVDKRAELGYLTKVKVLWATCEVPEVCSPRDLR